MHCPTDAAHKGAHTLRQVQQQDGSPCTASYRQEQTIEPAPNLHHIHILKVQGSTRVGFPVQQPTTVSTGFNALTSGPRSKSFLFVENRGMTEAEEASVLLRGRVCEQWEVEDDEATLTWVLEYMSVCTCVCVCVCVCACVCVCVCVHNIEGDTQLAATS